MNKYSITVKEVSEVDYVIEANSEEEAEKLFSNWVDSHQEWVYDDLSENSFGWEYSDALECDFEPDITYDELLRN